MGRLSMLWRGVLVTPLISVAGLAFVVLVLPVALVAGGVSAQELGSLREEAVLMQADSEAGSVSESPAALPGALEVTIDPAAIPAAEAPSEPSSHRSELERTWFEAGVDLGRRAKETRIRALQLGASNVEGAALALVAPGGPGDALTKAIHAVRLAPDLPVAYVARAAAEWDQGERGSAVHSLFEGLRAIPRHLTATLWLAGSVLAMFAIVTLAGALLFIAAVGIRFLGQAGHDLGDLLPGRSPAFARAALLSALLLLPLLLGEGLLGLALALFALGVAYGADGYRPTLAFAAVLAVIGLHPVARYAGLALGALHADPVARAVHSVVSGTAGEADRDLLRVAAGRDDLAANGLAIDARRAGRWVEAADRYELLLERQPRDPIALANLGNIRFAEGDTDAAVALYTRSAGLVDSARLMFNLSQAYARSFQIDEFESAMRLAQFIDGDAVVDLSRVGDPDFVADLPFPVSRLRSRMLKSAGGAGFARQLSQLVSPGRLGQSWMTTAGGFACAFALALLLGSQYERSSECHRCGRRICARCDGSMWNTEICDGCHHLFHRPEATDAALRSARLNELRKRQARVDKIETWASIVLPGAAGLLARRPDLGLVGLQLALWVVVMLVWRGGVVPDPLVVGSIGPMIFTLAAFAALCAYAVVVLAGLVIRRTL